MNILSTVSGDWIKTAFLFIVVLLLAYIVGISIVNLVDHKIGEIQIKLPKIQVDTHLDVSKDANDLIRISHRDHSKTFDREAFQDVLPIEGTQRSVDPAPLTQEDVDIPDVTVDRDFHMIKVPYKSDGIAKTPKCVANVGCKTDNDCNIVNGDGLNVCKKDGTCHCVSGSGTFCQYGPTNYKDPKDMTDIERRTFKYKFRNNFTLQDYKNWLMLYKDDSHHLREHHRDNLSILLRGGNLTQRDIPNVRIKPPMEASDYFAKMYEGGKISVHFPEDNETGPMLPYNYGKYGEFIPPENTAKSWITGVVDLYKRPIKDDAREVNFYLRPEVTVGVERELVGEEYLNWVKRHHNLADIRKIQMRKDESINTFQSSEKNINAPV